MLLIFLRAAIPTLCHLSHLLSYHSDKAQPGEWIPGTLLLTSVIATWSSSQHLYGRISCSASNRIRMTNINGRFGHLSYSV